MRDADPLGMEAGTFYPPELSLQSGSAVPHKRKRLDRGAKENPMAVSICRAVVGAGILLSDPLPALALSSSASQQAQFIGEATTLAKACRLPFDKKVAQAVIARSVKS